MVALRRCVVPTMVSRVRGNDTTHHPYHPLDDIIDVGEIAAQVSVVVDVDGLAGKDALGKLEVGHVGTSPRTIHGKEAQSGAGDVVEVVVALGHQLVGALAYRIHAGRVVHPIVR